MEISTHIVNGMCDIVWAVQVLEERQSQLSTMSV